MHRASATLIVAVIAAGRCADANKQKPRHAAGSVRRRLVDSMQLAATRETETGKTEAKQRKRAGFGDGGLYVRRKPEDPIGIASCRQIVATVDRLEIPGFLVQ